MQIAQDLSLCSLRRGREVNEQLGYAAIIHTVGKMQPAQLAEVVANARVYRDIVIFPGYQIVPPCLEIVLCIHHLLSG